MHSKLTTLENMSRNCISSCLPPQVTTRKLSEGIKKEKIAVAISLIFLIGGMLAVGTGLACKWGYSPISASYKVQLALVGVGITFALTSALITAIIMCPLPKGEAKSKGKNNVGAEERLIASLNDWVKAASDGEVKEDREEAKEAILECYQTKSPKLNLGPKIGSLPPEIGLLTHLKKLDLSECDLIELPKEIGNLINLKKLYISENKLETLPSELSNLTQLEEIDLSDNPFTSVVTFLAELKSLKEVYVDTKDLEEKETERLKQLADSGKIYLVLDGVDYLEEKKVIAILDAWIKEALSEEVRGRQAAKKRILMCYQKAASTLDLRNLNMGPLPPLLGFLTHLKKLDLGENNLTVVPPEIGLLRQLEVLYLDNNGLTALPKEIGKLTRLIKLGLWSNGLRDLPSEMTYSMQLKTLDLSNNPMQTIPACVASLIHLTELTINREGLDKAEVDRLNEMGNIIQFYEDLSSGSEDSSSDLEED